MYHEWKKYIFLNGLVINLAIRSYAVFCNKKRWSNFIFDHIGLETPNRLDLVQKLDIAGTLRRRTQY